MSFELIIKALPVSSVASMFVHEVVVIVIMFVQWNSVQLTQNFG